MRRPKYNVNSHHSRIRGKYGKITLSVISLAGARTYVYSYLGVDLRYIQGSSIGYTRRPISASRSYIPIKNMRAWAYEKTEA